MKVQDKVAEIAKLCVEITMNTEHDVFFDYYANIQVIDIKIFYGGWVVDTKWNKNIGTHLYDDGLEQDLNLIIKQLQDLLK
jgi:hypothetical protein